MKANTKWLPLFSTNFFGVLNDNFLKNLVCFIGVLWMAKENNSIVIMIASAMLVIPYLFFSPLAGKLAKTRYKKSIVVTAKLAEIPIMIIASIGFITESIYMVMASIFFMGLQSALYSPSKYGLIRDIGGNKEISFGTGTMEMLTFTAVLIGTFCASVVADHYNVYILIVTFLTLAVIGWMSSLKISVTESEPVTDCKDTINPVKFLIESFKWAQTIKGLNIKIISLGVFWLIGSLLQMNLLVHCPGILEMTSTQTGIVISAAAVGIGLGCYLAGVLSKDKVAMNFVPIGGIGISVNLGIIYFFQPQGILFTILIFLTALSSGFYKVPLNSWIQENVKGRMLGDMLAYVNLIEFIFILISAGIFGLMENFLDSNAVFLALFLFSVSITVVLSLENKKQIQACKNDKKEVSDCGKFFVKR